jgi:predicted ATPase
MTSSGLTLGSAMVIEFAQRRLSSRVGWLFTHRVGEPARLAGGSTSTTVGPLTVAGLHQVLDDRLDHAFTRPALSRIHAASAGNPLFAIEIARELVRTGDIVGAAPMPVPENLRRLIARRVHQLPPATRDALLACAALAQPTTSLVDEQVLAPAEEDGIVTVDDEGRIVFAHPLYASAVYGSAPRRRRRELHAELAELVDDVEERARHLAQAVDEPDERSAHALEGAAGVARSRGAWESAGELLEHAADLTPPVDRAELHRRVIGAAEHHAHAGDRARARSSLSEPSARRSLAH